MIQIDIDMPEKCGLCPLFHAEHPMYCQGVEADRKKKIVAPYRDPRPEWCPLHEVTADSDTISRKAAINALHDEIVRRRIDEDLNDDGALDEFDTEDILRKLPSAQPEKRTEERTKTHACDLIDRQAAIDAVKWGITYARAINTCTGETKELFKVSNHALNEAVERLKELPSAQPEVLACGEGELIAQPEIVRCKDCKHWKDSDGVYRRGIGAESKCPVNIRAVYEGNFYCADAERRTDE